MTVESSLPLAAPQSKIAKGTSVETITEAEFSLEIDRAIDLTSDDIKSFRALAISLPGGWGVKAMRMGVTSADAQCVYFFRTGVASDASPTVMVLRTVDGYMPVVWDLVPWLKERQHEALRCAELSDTVTAIRDIICECIEVEDDGGLTEGRIPSGSDKVHHLYITNGPMAGTFFPILGGRS